MSFQFSFPEIALLNQQPYPVRHPRQVGKSGLASDVYATARLA
jgi:hypothetical protein